jgi:YhcH/YjgK/YiaL family protein
MASCGSFATVRAQATGNPGFSRAFSYLEEVLRSGSPAWTRISAIAAGESHKVELGDGVFAIEQVYETKPRAAGFFESHRKYVDLQAIVAGEEAMELIDASRLAPEGGYDSGRDLVLYRDHEATAVSVLRLRPGEVAVFHPADVHMPGLRVTDAPVLVRKSVVKVPVA